jgi:hypothetical protein
MVKKLMDYILFVQRALPEGCLAVLVEGYASLACSLAV